MYKPDWHLYASSTAAMAKFEAVGQPFEINELIWERGNTKTPGYLKVLPLGLFSALELDGFTRGSGTKSLWPLRNTARVIGLP